MQAFRFKHGKIPGEATFKPVVVPPSRSSLAATSTSPAPKQKKAGHLPSELLGDDRLRLIIVGHNPSETAWRLGHYYANPSNWMWRILKETGLAPEQISGASDDHLMPTVAGVGFTDVGSGVPGTDSSQFKAHHFDAWRQPFFTRLTDHVKRVQRKLGCTCGECGYPTVVAFSGKKQFSELFMEQPKAGRRRITTDKEVKEVAYKELSMPPVRLQQARPSTVTTGRQFVLPTGWPFPLSTEVWVMTSTSGAAPMTREQRYAPWKQLHERLESIEEWKTWEKKC